MAIDYDDDLGLFDVKAFFNSLDHEERQKLLTRMANEVADEIVEEYAYKLRNNVDGIRDKLGLRLAVRKAIADYKKKHNVRIK